MHGNKNVKFKNTITRSDLHLQAKGCTYLKMASKHTILNNTELKYMDCKLKHWNKTCANGKTVSASSPTLKVFHRTALWMHIQG